MRATYVDFTCDILKKEAVGTPIYTRVVLRSSLEQPISLIIRKLLLLPLLHSNALWMERFFLS